MAQPFYNTAFEGMRERTMPDIVQGLSQTFTQAEGTLVLADMNGDRLQDLVLLSDTTNGGPLYWPGQGFGQFDDSISGYGVTLTDGPDFDGDPTQAASLELADLNGDGLADLYQISGSFINYWLNEGGVQFGRASTLWLDYFFDPGQATYRLLDLDGDGLQEILHIELEVDGGIGHTLDHAPLVDDEQPTVVDEGAPTVDQTNEVGHLPMPRQVPLVQDRFPRDGIEGVREIRLQKSPVRMQPQEASNRGGQRL